MKVNINKFIYPILQSINLKKIENHSPLLFFLGSTSVERKLASKRSREVEATDVKNLKKPAMK